MYDRHHRTKATTITALFWSFTTVDILNVIKYSKREWKDIYKAKPSNILILKLQKTKPNETKPRKKRERNEEIKTIDVFDEKKGFVFHSKKNHKTRMQSLLNPLEHSYFTDSFNFDTATDTKLLKTLTNENEERKW